MRPLFPYVHAQDDYFACLFDHDQPLDCNSVDLVWSRPDIICASNHSETF